MTRPIIFEWTGEAMVPVRGFAKAADAIYVVGEKYRLVEEAERSALSHRHYFAAIAEAWSNLPEQFDGRFPTPEHLRKWALIRTGYFDQRSIIAASKAEARRLAAFVAPMDEFAVVTVTEAEVRVLTAKSQSLRAMGSKAFQESKSNVLDFLAQMVAVDRAELERAAA